MSLTHKTSLSRDADGPTAPWRSSANENGTESQGAPACAKGWVRKRDDGPKVRSKPVGCKRLACPNCREYVIYCYERRIARVEWAALLTLKGEAKPKRLVEWFKRHAPAQEFHFAWCRREYGGALRTSMLVSHLPEGWEDAAKRNGVSATGAEGDEAEWLAELRMCGSVQAPASFRRVQSNTKKVTDPDWIFLPLGMCDAKGYPIVVEWPSD